MPGVGRNGAEKVIMRAPLGLIYTILVDGRPVVALEATGREAVELCREEWFRTELCALSSNGEPLCRIGSKLQARVAVEEERTSYQEASKEVQASDDILLIYLVELDDL
jgi:hypothetical protein